MSDTFWLVGRRLDREPWQFQGVFATEKRAIAACRDESYFVGPVVIGEEIPHDKAAWPGAWYPLIETDSVSVEG